MQRQTIRIDQTEALIYQSARPAALLLQPVEARNENGMEPELSIMEQSGRGFVLAAFPVEDWNRDLSPWEAPPVYGKTPFGGGAEKTLQFLTERLVPALYEQLTLPSNLPACIGGYSLAGLFALWAGTRTALFSGAAAASPSVWFPGWMDYVLANPIQSRTVYLSLGDREERTKNPLMSTVADRICELHLLLSENYDTILEWNPGNHFQDPAGRMGSAFCWLLNRIGTEGG